MGLVKHVAKEFFKEVDDKSREFFEFVLPPIDLHEENDNLVVTVDIPGFVKNDIKVSMNGNVLSINAEKKDNKNGRTIMKQRPRVMESIKTGKIEKINIVRESLMGGMSCGEPSLVPWKILKKSVNNCISLPDNDIAKAMKLFANASFGDDKIIAGENSAPGVISLIASCNDENIKNKLNLDYNSNILLIGCEGDTDQEMYQKLLKE